MNNVTTRGMNPTLVRFMWRLYNAAAAVGLRPQITSTVRDSKKQAQLYRDWIAGRSRYPAAPPGRSSHARGLAFDMTVTPRRALSQLGQLWESVGGTWGGRFSDADPVHFELRYRGRP